MCYFARNYNTKHRVLQLQRKQTQLTRKKQDRRTSSCQQHNLERKTSNYVFISCSIKRKLLLNNRRLKELYVVLTPVCHVFSKRKNRQFLEKDSSQFPVDQFGTTWPPHGHYDVMRRKPTQRK